MSAPSYAMMLEECTGTEGAKYPNISTAGGNGTDFPVYCQRVNKIDDQYISLYGKTSADCTQAGRLANDPESCGDAEDEEIDEGPMIDDEDDAIADAIEDEDADNIATDEQPDGKVYTYRYSYYHSSTMMYSYITYDLDTPSLIGQKHRSYYWNQENQKYYHDTNSTILQYFDYNNEKSTNILLPKTIFLNTHQISQILTSLINT